jgi:glycosyltransferase involved in cell wall biosynthesis
MTDLNERPPIASAPISVILPARNAGTEVEEVVAAWIKFLDGMARDYEVLVVDDASSDDTRQRAEALTKAFPRVRLISQPERRGFGAALRTGIAAARYPLLFYTTCDKQYHPDDLGRLLKEIDKVDLVVGYRIGAALPAWLACLDAIKRILVRIFLGMSLERRDCWLGLNGSGRRWAARWLFGLRLRDPECVFGLFRRENFKRIPIQNDGDLAPIEILAKANFLGCMMAEVPVTCLARKGRRYSAGWDSPGPPRRQIRELFRRPDFGPVNPEAVRTATSLRSSAEAAIFGQPLTLTAVITIEGEAVAKLSGTVVFMEGARQIGTAQVHDRTATMTSSKLSVGSHSLSATYAGDRDFQGSSSSVLMQKVDPVPTMVLIVSSSASVKRGEELKLTATIKGEYAEKDKPSGEVAFRSGADLLESVPLIGDTASLLTSSLPVGTHAITACYEGDSRFAASTSVPVTVTVLPPEQVPSGQ